MLRLRPPNGYISLRSVMVPGTDFLAEITAKDPIFHQGPDLLRDQAAVLNAPVGEAATAV